MTHDPGGALATPLAVLVEITGALADEDGIDPTLDRILTTATRAAGASVGAVYLQDPDTGTLSLGPTTGLDDKRRSAVEGALAEDDDAVASVARDRTARSTTTGAFVSACDIAAARISPIAVRRGGVDEPLGVLAIGWQDEHAVADEAPELLDACAAAIGVAIDRGRLASLVAERSDWYERVAHTDPLTGLANQRTFARVLELELARAGRQGSEVSLAIFDVDDFAATNEAAGREAGDDVLRAVASVLAETVRLVDTVARYGGDEFVVIAPGPAGMAVARRVLEGAATLQPVAGRPVTISAGVARFPVDGTNGDELLASAEGALGKARASGHGAIASASPGSD
ncbi:MAG: GGDEF domain-containing protein [Chloroflexi bacterium]|nr:MAG: GGDEF domain-containing protein [Chloroflexota bacterium]